MKQYELTVMIHPDLEMNLTPALEKVQKVIDANGGKILKDESEGKKHLAYPIDGQNFACYHFYTLELPAQAPQKISSSLNIMDEVIRYLLVTVDPRKAKYEAKRAARQEKTSKTEE